MFRTAARAPCLIAALVIGSILAPTAVAAQDAGTTQTSTRPTNDPPSGHGLPLLNIISTFGPQQIGLSLAIFGFNPAERIDITANGRHELTCVTDEAGYCDAGQIALPAGHCYNIEVVGQRSLAHIWSWVCGAGSDNMLIILQPEAHDAIGKIALFHLTPGNQATLYVNDRKAASCTVNRDGVCTDIMTVPMRYLHCYTFVLHDGAGVSRPINLCLNPEPAQRTPIQT